MFADWVFTSPSLLVVAAILVLAASCAMTLRAAGRRVTSPKRRWVVVMLNLAAYGTIMLLLWQPMKPREVTGTVTLVTDKGFEADNAYAGPRVLAGTEEATGLTPLPSVAVLPRREPDMAVLTVKGHGLSGADLAALPDDVALDWQAPTLTGIMGARWRKSLPLGEELVVSAEYHAPLGKEGEVFTAGLKDPAGNTVAEARLKSGDRFVLRATPKLSGPLMYSLTLSDRLSAPMQAENIPVSVQMPAPVNMLVVQSAPSFEARHLLEWAARFDAKLAVHTRMSRDRYIRQASDGAEDTGLPPLAQSSLDAADFLLMDGRSLMLLNAGERSVLQQAIKGGLGVLMLADSALLGALDDFEFSPFEGFSAAPIAGQITSAVPLWAGGSNEVALPILPMQLMHSEADVLVRAASGRALNLATSFGLGKIALTTLRDRHVWTTSGDSTTFANYWTFILSNIARQTRDQMLLPQADGTLARVHEMIPLCLASQEENTGLKIRAMTGDFLRHTRATQTSTLSPHHCSFFQSEASGWYEISLENLANSTNEPAIRTTDKSYIYIHERDEWRTEDQFTRQTATNRYLALHRNTAEQAPRQLLQKAIPTFWLWLLLVVSASLLWLERKLD